MAIALLYGSSSEAAACRIAVGCHISPEAPRVSNSHQWLKNPLVASPKLSISVSGSRMAYPGFGTKALIKCTKDETHETSKMVEVDGEVVPRKRRVKIHDFCLGIPFGGLLFSMGLLGFLFSRSSISLILGVAPGFATLSFGILSLTFWKIGRSSLPFILGQAAVTALLVWKYAHAYYLTKQILPWGFYAFLSAAMICFYSYVLLAGENPPPKKLTAAPPS